jgi:hypothetical protein
VTIRHFFRNLAAKERIYAFGAEKQKVEEGENCKTREVERVEKMTGTAKD